MASKNRRKNTCITLILLEFKIFLTSSLSKVLQISLPSFKPISKLFESNQQTEVGFDSHSIVFTMPAFSTFHISSVFDPVKTKFTPLGQNSTNSMLDPNLDLVFKFVVNICKRKRIYKLIIIIMTETQQIVNYISHTCRPLIKFHVFNVKSAPNVNANLPLG